MIDAPGEADATPPYDRDFLRALDARAAESRVRFERDREAARRIDRELATRLGSMRWLERAEAHARQSRTFAAAGKPVVINVHIAATDFRKGSISV